MSIALPSIVDEISQIEALSKKLLQSKHYSKIGPDGIFAIVQKAQSLGLNPIECLNGGMYFVQGKVELNSILMAKLIRMKGHSITCSQNDSKACILHGKRSDNGDTWKVTFTIEDAKRAGIYKEGGPWTKYPDVMCYNRALSKLARQLFPDLIGNCYIEGEIERKPDAIPSSVSIETGEVFVDTSIPEERMMAFEDMLASDEEYKKTVLDFVKKRFNTEDLSILPLAMFDKLYTKCEDRMNQRNEAETSTNQEGHNE